MANLTKEEIKLLIPWYLNGTLNDEENKIVEEYLGNNPSSKEEIGIYNLIKSSVNKADKILEQESSPQFAMMEEAIMQRIDSAAKTETVFSREPKETLTDKISAFFQSFTLPAMNPVPIAALLLIQFALIAGLIAKLYFEEPNQYTILSGEETVETQGIKIMVVFENSATEKEIRDILLDINAKIVDGPKANGIYILSVGNEENTIKAESIIKELKSKKEIIKLVEEAY